MVNQDQMGNIYGKWQIAENTWCITNRWSNFMYLLIGEEKALLIDTGAGEANIRACVESMTDKPIMVVNTHGHFDHTGGNFYWPEVWMKAESIPSAREAFALMDESWFARKDYPEYKINTLEDGEIIDLGNREVQVLAIGAHNRGSIALLDRQSRALFSGDELESGQVLLFAKTEKLTLKESLTRHKKGMEKLKSLRKDFDYIWPGHNGVPLLPDQYLEDFITLDEQILAGTAQIAENVGGFGFPIDASQGPFAQMGTLERAEYGVAAIVYQKE